MTAMPVHLVKPAALPFLRRSGRGSQLGPQGSERWASFNDLAGRHRQLAASESIELAGRRRHRYGYQAAAATPQMSAHISNACIVAVRSSLVEAWLR
jgi:hypothetical protein